MAIEYEAVCAEQEHRSAAGLTRAEADTFVTAIVALAEPVVTFYLWRPQLSDASDEMVLETAVNGGADVLVTFNRRHYGSIPARFGIEVLLPREVLHRIRK